MNFLKSINTQFWIKISLLSFLVVALLGTLMRYKIAYDFPFFNQKNLQHAHSHFAFVGWVSQLLMLYIIDPLKPHLQPSKILRYNIILTANFIVAIGM
nr:hypothetical protein [Saprospiraceae bacterium]